MSEHDKFCPADTPLGGGCECEVIAAIRADEGERAAKRYAPVLRAWTNAGPRRDIHAKAQTWLRREWPALADALDAAAAREVCPDTGYPILGKCKRCGGTGVVAPGTECQWCGGCKHECAPDEAAVRGEDGAK